MNFKSFSSNAGKEKTAPRGGFAWLRKHAVSAASLLVVTAMMLSMTPHVPFNTVEAVGSGSTGPRSYSVGGNVFLGNNKMELGINQYGSFGSTANAPTSGSIIFHPWVSASNKIGLVSAPWGGARDYFLPGTVDEGFVFYWGGAQKAYVKSSKIGVADINNYSGYSTTDNSTKELLSATTKATVASALQYTQNISFKADDGFSTMTVTLKNITSSTLTGVTFIRGFDPDQGSDAKTSNYYHKDADGAVWIIATPTQRTGSFDSVEKFASGVSYPFIYAAPASKDYTVTPMTQKVGWGSYNDFTPVTNLNSASYADVGIGLKFTCGNLAPGAEVKITFFMSLDSDVSSALGAIKDALNSMIDYENETLTGLKANATYKIICDGVEYKITADSTGAFPLTGKDNSTSAKSYDLIGKKFTIVEIDKNGEDVSQSQQVTVAGRPEAPSGDDIPTAPATSPTLEISDISTTADSVTVNDAKADQEYSIDGVKWVKPTSGKVVFTSLKSDTEYTIYTRFPATDKALASEAATVKATTQPMVKDMTVTESQYSGTYDGKEHHASVTKNVDGADIKYSTSLSGTFSADPVKFKNAGTYTVYYSVEKEGYYPTYGDLSITIAPKEIGIAWGTTDFVYDGNEKLPTATATGLESGDECTLTVTGKQTNAGVGYTATVTACSNKNYKLPANASTTFDIKHESQSAPTPAGVNETVSGKNDGKLTSVDSAMEYRMDGETEYTPVSGTEVTGLAPGTYYVRYKETANYFASPDVQVVIGTDKYIVTYMVDGEFYKAIEVENGKDVTETPEIPTKPGYDQTAPVWDNDGKSVTANRVINAVYTINEYTVTFDAVGGVISGDSELRTIGGKLTSLADKPFRVGYDFDGWFTAAEGGTAVDIDALITAPTTYYAHWTQRTVDIDTDNDGDPDVNLDTDKDGDPDVNIDTDGDYKPDVNVDTDGDGDPDTNLDNNGDNKPDVNIDTDGDGKPDVNVDTDGDGKPDINLDTDGDGKPDTDIDTDGDSKPDVNVDTDGDGDPDINIDTNGDGKPDVNVDTDGDGDPDINVDTDGDGDPDINIDTDGDGEPDVNVDTDGDGKPDINVDTDGDGDPDINVDTDGDGDPDINLDTDGDGDPDINIDTNGDGDPDVNVDTDDDGDPDINVDTDDDGDPDINVDTDGDGKPDTNVDTDNDGDPDINVDTNGDGKPDTNIDTDNDGTPDINVDTNGDGTPDINVDTDNDGTPDVNVDTDGDSKPDINVDTDGDGDPDTNVDTDGDGDPDINIDTNGDGTPDTNIDTDNDGDPDINVDTNGDGTPDINVDTDNDGKADTNIDTDNDGTPDTNIDTDDDGKADTNIDTDGDGKADINIDTDGDGKADVNIDADADGKPDVNIDTDGDGKADINIDTDGDSKPDTNVDTDGDGKADVNIDTDGDGKRDYKIIKGIDEKYTLSTTKTLAFTANGMFTGFVGVKVDDIVIDASEYIVMADSTTVELKPEFLDSLSVGRHSFTIMYKDGEASCNFYIESDLDIPQTGDDSTLMLWSVIMTAALVAAVSLGVTALLLSRKRRDDSI